MCIKAIELSKILLSKDGKMGLIRENLEDCKQIGYKLGCFDVHEFF